MLTYVGPFLHPDSCFLLLQYPPSSAASINCRSFTILCQAQRSTTIHRLATQPSRGLFSGSNSEGRVHVSYLRSPRCVTRLRIVPFPCKEPLPTKTSCSLSASHVFFFSFETFRLRRDLFFFSFIFLKSVQTSDFLKAVLRLFIFLQRLQ